MGGGLGVGGEVGDVEDEVALGDAVDATLGEGRAVGGVFRKGAGRHAGEGADGGFGKGVADVWAGGVGRPGSSVRGGSGGEQKYGGNLVHVDPVSSVDTYAGPAL